jgi:hypothetical protein
VSYWRSRSQRSPKVVSIPPIAQALNRRPFGSSAASQPRGRKAPLFAVEISSTLGNSVQGASIPDLPTGADLWGNDTPRDGVWSVSYFTFENFFDRLSRPRHHGCKDGKYVDADHRCPERVISGCACRSAARRVNLNKRTRILRTRARAYLAILIRRPDDDVLDLISRRIQAHFQIRCAAKPPTAEGAVSAE